MYNTMKKGNTFVNSTKYGVAKVQEGGFAYLTDEPYLDYYNMKEPCNTTMLKNLLEAKSYGIALQRNSDLTDQISVAILKVTRKIKWVIKQNKLSMKMSFLYISCVTV